MLNSLLRHFALLNSLSPALIRIGMIAAQPAGTFWAVVLNSLLAAKPELLPTWFATWVN